MSKNTEICYKKTMHLSGEIKRVMGKRYQGDITCVRNVQLLVQRCEFLEKTLESRDIQLKEQDDAKSNKERSAKDG